MKIGVVGSCYGELDRVYEAVRKLSKQGITIDLLICCGDFMAVRDEKDLEHVAAPAHHKEDLKDFPKYFSGRSEAPVTTIFIGGKNEASNLLREHYYGGWVAPGIYFLGAAGVLRVGPLRIAGISGSFASGDYFRGRHECPPYTEEFKRSAFHAREWDAARLEKLQEPVDVVISYDWPRGIWKHGPYEKIIEQQDLGENHKREMEGGTLGSPAAMELMKKLRPPFWFSASLQVRFPALVSHGDGTFTRFLALERCKGGREFLQVLDIDPRTPSALRSLPAPKWNQQQPAPGPAVPLCYDAEWMAMQKVNHENISFTWHPSKSRVTPPSKDDLLWIKQRLKSICGSRPRPLGSRHPNLTATKLRKSRGAGRHTFQNFSTLQLRELFEIRGMDFPGHLDKASMIKHLEDFDALHGGEDQSKDGEESYPIPTGFIAAPATQRRKILEILELPDIWKVQEEQRSHLLRTAQQGAVDVSYDPFSQEPGEDPGTVTGRSPSPSSSEEETFMPPAPEGSEPIPNDSKLPKSGEENEEMNERREEDGKGEAGTAGDDGANGDDGMKGEDGTTLDGTNGDDGATWGGGDVELKKMLERLGAVGTEHYEAEIAATAVEDAVEDPEEPAELVDLEPVEPVELPALEDDLDHLEAELALAEQLLKNPDGDPTVIPVVADEEPADVPTEAGQTAEQAAQLLAQAVMGLKDLDEVDPGDGPGEFEDIDGGEVMDVSEPQPKVSGFAALALAVEEADREEAELQRQQPRKRRRF